MVWRKSSLIVILGLLCIVAHSQTFDESHWEETVKELNYGDVHATDPPPEKTEPIDIDPPSWKAPVLGTAGKVIVISLFAILLIFLIAKLLGNNALSGRGRIEKDRLFSFDELEEHIHETDLERYLRISLEEGNYQAALRVYYLMIIKSLSELEFIRWKKDKTNYDYVREMRSKDGYSIFRNLTHTFEIVWYGEIGIGKEEYTALAPDFESFYSSLKQQFENGSERG